MTSIFSNTRLASLAGKRSPAAAEASENLYDDSVPATTTTAAMLATPQNVRKYLKIFWVVGAIMSVFVPAVVRNSRMNADQNSAWRSVANKYNTYVKNQQQWQNVEGQAHDYYQDQEQQEGQMPQFFDVNWNRQGYPARSAAYQEFSPKKWQPTGTYSSCCPPVFEMM